MPPIVIHTRGDLKNLYYLRGSTASSALSFFPSVRANITFLNLHKSNSMAIATEIIHIAVARHLIL